MTRLLLVEDETRLARSILVGLRDEQYVVDHARTGEEALWFLSTNHADAVILDLRLPGVGGLEICERVRAGGSKTPILVLTACDTKEDIVAGLDRGADDYLTKPFDFEVLLARLRALLRRGSAGRPARLRVADLELDTAARRVWRAGREVSLTNMEYRVLEYLFLHTGAVQSKERITAAVWEDELGPDSNVLEVLISSLRRKLAAGDASPLLHTRRGSGYVLDGGGA